MSRDLHSVSGPQNDSRPQNENLIKIISEELPSLNKTEAKVAQVILADPEAATQTSIAVLAKKSGVSEPSVNRFCKRFKAKGFPDLKLKLAKAVVIGIPFVGRNLEPERDASSYTKKIIDSTISNLALMGETIGYQRVNQVVDSLIQAKRIYFFGLGDSGAVARYAENKFFRFNLPVSFHDDVLMQRMLATTGTTGDVFFIISQTGRTKEMIEVAQIAKANDSTVIALTSSKSPLEKLSSKALYVDIPKNSDEYMSIPSRIIPLVILDILATGVTLRRGPEFLPHLEKIKNSLKSTRF